MKKTQKALTTLIELLNAQDQNILLNQITLTLRNHQSGQAVMVNDELMMKLPSNNIVTVTKIASARIVAIVSKTCEIKNNHEDFTVVLDDNPIDASDASDDK